MRYTRILAATDFSELGDLALRRAAEIARDQAAHLTVLHVLPAPPAPSPFFAHYEVREDEDKRREAIEGAVGALRERVVRQVGANSDLLVEYLVRVGDPAEEITLAIRDTQADLVVMSTSGRRGFQRFIMGSVAEQVLRVATIDVLAVRPARDGDGEMIGE
jgi:nucleotide-binding universal stress UspA family protein